jgi:hypothetical protein
VTIADGAVRALGAEHLPVYLCCHAAGHAFFRLKWMADISRVFDRLGPAGVSRACEWARAWGCERPFWAALLLDSQLRGRAPPLLDSAEGVLHAPLASYALRAIGRGESDREHAIRDIPEDLRAALYGMRLAASWRARAFPLLRLLTHPDDARVLKLGSEWVLLYAVLGRVLAAMRLAQRLFARHRSERS